MPAIGQSAPGFELPDLTGTIYRLSDYCGRIVIVNFWSAECPWVERADRELVTYLHGWGGRVALLTIAANANEPDALCAAAVRTRSLPLVLRGSSEVLDAYAAQTTPHLFVVDAGGILRYRGALDDITFHKRVAARFYLKAAVESLLAGNLPDIPETHPYGCTVVRHLPDLC